MMFSKLEVTVEEINKDVPLYNKEKLALRTHISVDGNKFGSYTDYFNFFDPNITEKIINKVSRVLMAKHLIESFKDVEW